MKLIYPMISEPIGPDAKIIMSGNRRINPVRQYKKSFCKTFGVTGSRYRKIQKIQRRILESVRTT